MAAATRGSISDDDELTQVGNNEAKESNSDAAPEEKVLLFKTFAVCRRMLFYLKFKMMKLFVKCIARTTFLFDVINSVCLCI